MTLTNNIIPRSANGDNGETTRHCSSAILKHLTARNWRGATMPDLICEYQYQLGLLEDIKSRPEAFIYSNPIPSGWGREEYLEDYESYYGYIIEGIIAEVERRERMTFNNPPDRHIIETIKVKIGGSGLADIIGQYTQVYYHKDNWAFRCTVHGDGIDKTPAGVIYPDEGRWWCFVCNKGGDVFDAVCHFERTDLTAAIKKLARYTGIDFKSPVKRPAVIIRGGVAL